MTTCNQLLLIAEQSITQQNGLRGLCLPIIDKKLTFYERKVFLDEQKVNFVEIISSN